MITNKINQQLSDIYEIFIEYYNGDMNYKNKISYNIPKTPSHFMKYGVCGFTMIKTQ